MTMVLWVHIAGGVVALAAGSVAVIARKGGALHAGAGRWFVGVMLLLWMTATVLHLREGKPEAAVGDLFIGYFVVTSWLAARRRDGTTGWIEAIACVLILGLAGVIAWGVLAGTAAPTPVGVAPLVVLSGACALAGLLDLSAILRARLSPAQRISRHLWRMCSAFFIATGSFFLGQQDALPEAVRGSPALVVLAFAPFGVMVFWLARIRFGKGMRPAFAGPMGPTLRRFAPQAPPSPNLSHGATRLEEELGSYPRSLGAPCPHPLRKKP